MLLMELGEERVGRREWGGESREKVCTLSMFLKAVGRPEMRSYELRLRVSGPPCISNNSA
jgi:hypothetical protein